MPDGSPRHRAFVKKLGNEVYLVDVRARPLHTPPPGGTHCARAAPLTYIPRGAYAGRRHALGMYIGAPE